MLHDLPKRFHIVYIAGPYNCQYSQKPQKDEHQSQRSKSLPKVGRELCEQIRSKVLKFAVPFSTLADSQADWPQGYGL